MNKIKRYKPIFEATDVETPATEDPFASVGAPQETTDLDPNIETEIKIIIEQSTGKFYNGIIQELNTFVLENKYDDATKEKILSGLADRVKEAIDAYEDSMKDIWKGEEETSESPEESESESVFEEEPSEEKEEKEEK